MTSPDHTAAGPSDDLSAPEVIETGILASRIQAPDLLPCPFCGSPAGLEAGNGWPGETVVRCANGDCGAEMTGAWPEKTASQLWNDRAASPPPPEADSRPALAARGFTSALPDRVGLWEFAAGETDWKPERVAITAYAVAMVHDAELGTLPVEAFHAGLTGTLWRRLA